jgi:ATP-dependent 26S proteasome regulatory subunit
MMVGTLEEIVDARAIVSAANDPESYVSIMSFVDKDRIKPGRSALLNHKNQVVVDALEDDADPLVSVMKLDKAPMECYADISGLQNQIQEIKVVFLYFGSYPVTFSSLTQESVELPLTQRTNTQEIKVVFLYYWSYPVL